MNVPEKLFLRRGEVRALLGIDRRLLAKLIDSGALRRHYLCKGSRAYFLSADVARMISENIKENKVNDDQ